MTEATAEAKADGQAKATIRVDAAQGEFEKLLSMEHRATVDLYAERANDPALDAWDRMHAIRAGRKILEEMLDKKILEHVVMPMMNTPLGFLTDKDPTRSSKCKAAYPPAVVRECVIDAFMLGVGPVGNEFNIISGKVYITKAGFARKIKSVRGFRDLLIDLDPPEKRGGGVVVKATATWIHNSVPGKITRTFPIKTDQYSSGDQTLGKAERKILAAVWAHVTQNEWRIPDGDVGDLQGVPAKPEDLITKVVERPVDPGKIETDAKTIDKLFAEADAKNGVGELGGEDVDVNVGKDHPDRPDAPAPEPEDKFGGVAAAVDRLWISGQV